MAENYLCGPLSGAWFWGARLWGINKIHKVSFCINNGLLRESKATQKNSGAPLKLEVAIQVFDDGHLRGNAPAQKNSGAPLTPEVPIFGFDDGFLRGSMPAQKNSGVPSRPEVPNPFKPAIFLNWLNIFGKNSIDFELPNERR